MPKDPKENRRRRRLYEAAGRISEEFRIDCWARASRDYVWYVDAFGWTHNSKDYAEEPRRPFILRDYQEDLAKLLIKSVGVHDVIIPKARDMGATWTALTVVMYLWQFFEFQTIHMGSSKQELVDKLGDPRCLFWKLDFYYKMLPKWFRPPLRPDDRKLNSLTNPTNDSAITGEATTPNFGRAARPGVIVLDEFAAVEDGYPVLSATRDATKTRWFISTFQGAYGAFYERHQKMVKERPQHVFSIPWFKHPEKRRGLYTSKLIAAAGGKKEHYELEILDKEYVWPVDPATGKNTYKFHLDGKMRSVWFDEEEVRAGSPQEMAQEVEMQAQASGWQFVSTIACEEYSKKHRRDPTHRGHLEFTDPNGALKWVEDPAGPVELWCSLNSDWSYQPTNDIGAGADIASGTSKDGGSNSVGAFYDSVLKEKIAQITVARMLPHKFAAYMVALCRFFQGPNGPALLNWEDVGPGEIFREEVVREFLYPRLWMRRDLAKMDASPSTVPGYCTRAGKKGLLLKNYRTALFENRIFNRCHDAIMECAEYIQSPSGSFEHNEAMSTTDRASSGDEHGDMVIADAIAYLTIQELPAAVENAEPQIPENSYEGRRRRFEEQKRTTRRGSW